MILKSQRNNNNHYVKNPKDPGTAEVNSLSNNVKSEPQKSYKIEISWRSTFLIALVHLFALKGGILLLTGQVSPAFFLIGKKIITYNYSDHYKSQCKLNFKVTSTELSQV